MGARIDVGRHHDAAEFTDIVSQARPGVALLLVGRASPAPLSQQDVAWLCFEYTVPGTVEFEVRMITDIEAGFYAKLQRVRYLSNSAEFRRGTTVLKISDNIFLSAAL